MEINKSTFTVAAIAAAILAVTLAWHNFTVNKLENQQRVLMNTVASKDKTIEIQKGVYEKLAQDHEGLVKMFDQTSVENKELAAQLKATKEKVATATDLSVYWKQKYEKVVAGTVTTVDTPPNTPPMSILPAGTLLDLSSGDVDFGFISSNCKVRTSNPPQFTLNIGPGSKPLGLRVLMSQSKDGAWHSYVTSDDQRVGINILATAIDTSQFAPKWYDKISARLELGLGTDGLLGGLGLQYRIGAFDVGPAAWLVITNKVQKYYGLTMTWYPF